MQISGIWAVIQFERKRTATRTRWLWWSVLTFFPVLIVGVNRLFGSNQTTLENFTASTFYLIPVVMCLLGQLLWATPFLQSELEGKTWSYLALKPHGKIHILLGKYLTAVVWSFSAAAISVTLVTFVSTPTIKASSNHLEGTASSSSQQLFEKDEQGNIRPNRNFGFRDVRRVDLPFSERVRIWGIYLLLTFFACVNFGALFCFLGVLVPRRAMVIAVAYSLILEIIVANIPAMINQFTIHFRLRSLLVEWVGGDMRSLMRNNPIFLTDVPQWQHIAVLLLLAPFLLSVSAYILSQRELLAADDSS